MGSFNYGIGKGLKEPCSPFRTATVFGAGLGTPDAGNWNCKAQIVNPTTSFDLSAISPRSEVVVALLTVSNTSAGIYNINFRWIRERDNALLFDSTFSHTPLAGEWLYGYSYIGWLSGEINENGGYRVEITVTGIDPVILVSRFNVSGIPDLPTPEPLPIRFMDNILRLMGTISSFFYETYQTAKGWIWPFNLLQYPLYGIYNTIWALWAPIGKLGEWIEGVVHKMLTILTSFDISEFFKDIFEAAINAWNWIQNAPSYIAGLMNLWFTTVTSTILGWINIAKQGLVTLITMAQTGVNLLMTTWDGFRKYTLPTLASWTGVTDLISSALASWVPDLSAIWSGVTDLIESTIRSWFPFYDELVSLWSEIQEFFTDPPQYVYNKLDEFFERFW